jgi:putative phosphoribosyl transferase
MITLSRNEAGRQLARRVMDRRLADPVVVVIPPGGVRIGWEIARRLRAPMDVMTVSPVEIPGPCARIIAAVADERVTPAGEYRDVDASYRERMTACATDVQRVHDALYRHGQPRLDLANRDVILVDDGWSTPLMLTAALGAIRSRGAATICLATPQCAPEVVPVLGEDVQLVSLFACRECRSVTLVDVNYRQLTDREAEELIRLTRLLRKPQPEPLMKAMPGASEASQACSVSRVHSGSQSRTVARKLSTKQG